jgi:hypothetical protein
VGLAFTGCADDGDDDDDGGGGGSTTFAGVAAGSGVSGALTVTVATSEPIPAARITGPRHEVTATGTFTPTGGSAVVLTGTYNDEDGALILSGGGYTFTGTYANGVISGTFTGPGGSGSFSVLAAPAGTARTYCGTFVSNKGGSGGTFNIAVSGQTLAGVAYVIDDDEAIPLIGTRDDDDSLHISIASSPPLPIAEGQISEDSTTVAGVYDNNEGDTGTFSGELCSSAGGNSTTFAGIAAGHAEVGALTITVQTSTPRPARVRGGGAVAATGIYYHTNVSHPLSGTYDPSTNVFSLSGSGYTFVGVYSSAGRQEGTWTRTGNNGEWVTATVSDSLDAYCGTFTSTSITNPGSVGLVLNGSVAMGVAVGDDSTDPLIPLDGVVEGNQVLIYFPATKNVFASGTIAGGGASITGTYDDGEGDSGTWTTTLCSVPVVVPHARLMGFRR